MILNRVWLLSFFLTFHFFVSHTQAESLNQKTPLPYVKDEILVQFKAGLSDSDKNRVLAPIGEARPLGMKDTFAIKIKNGMTVEEAIASIKRNPLIKIVQPNFLIHATRSLRPTRKNGYEGTKGMGKNAL